MATAQAKRTKEDGFEFSVATAPSTARHRQLAVAVVVATLIAYLIMLPNADTRLPQVDGFIPAVFAVIFVADLVTAVLLYAQYAATGSRPLLVLASGYLFSSLIVVGHALTFPSVFAPEGLLGAGPQSAAWLNVLWRLGFAASVAAYAVLRSRPPANTTAIEPAPRLAISWSVAIVVGVVCLLIYAAIAGQELLPPLLAGGEMLSLGRYANGIVTLMTLLALLLLLTLTRGKSILDLWLIVVAVALLAEGIMVTFFVPGRFSLAFYAIRLIALPVSKVVLIVLLWETMRLYRNLSTSIRELRRERANKLANAEAVVAAIAHDIRQPLTGINLLAYSAHGLLDRASPDVGAAKKLIGEIKDGAFRANEVFDGLLRFFRGGKQERQAVDVNALTFEATRLMRKDLEDHGVTASTHLASELPPVHGHAGQLREVILNLIQNAIDAMVGTTGRSRAIKIVTSHFGADTVSISVEDTGPGIEPEKLGKIFDPFVTTKPKGTGLGLAICKMIVEQHGGTLKAASGKEGGARFEITLPARTAARAASAPARE